MSIADYILDYPSLDNSALASLIIGAEDSSYAHRTLRRIIANERATTDAIPTVIPEKQETLLADPLPATALAYSKYYHYQSEADTYLLFLPAEKPCSLRGETVRALKAAYSDWDGQPQTINTICRRFYLSRKFFTKLKNALGWSHDSEPFTDETLITRSEEELLADLLQTKKFALEQKYETGKLEQQAVDARKWNEFRSGQLAPFEHQLTHRLELFQPPLPRLLPREPYVCVLSPFDLHYGKYAWTGETGTQYNRSIARHLLLTHTGELLSDMTFYAIDHFIVPVGSDFFHVDNDGMGTTKGTRQDMDGTPVQMLAEGCALMIEFINLLARRAPVTINMASGNHDQLLSHALLLYLEGYYRQSSIVTVATSHRSRQYQQWGNTMLGFTHGDGVKTADLPLLMMQESTAEGLIDNRIWFTGHYHHTKTTDLKGTLVLQMPSLSGVDRWHDRNGYVGSLRGMCAYLVCKQRGLRHQLHSTL